MNKILTILLFIPMLAIGSTSIENSFINGLKNDELLKDLFINQYFAPPYKSYALFNDLNGYCDNKISNTSKITSSDIDIIIKNDVLNGLSLNSESSQIFTILNNSGGVSTLSPYLNESFVRIINRNNRATAKNIAKEMRVKYNSSPMFKKVNDKVNDYIDGFEKVDKDEKIFLACLFVKIVKPVFLNKEMKYGSVLFQLDKDLKWAEFNENANRLDKSLKDLDEFNKQNQH